MNEFKIATHDSVTGERGYGIVSWLGTPFSRTQSKTIKEQIEAGCRLFDIRIRKTKRGWVCCHGIWESKKSLDEILGEINNVDGDVYCDITFEDDFLDNPVKEITIYTLLGKYFIHTNTTQREFNDKIEEIINKYSHIKFCQINVKFPTWKCIKRPNKVPCKSIFKVLDGTTWHTYLPIPWLWKKIYYNKPVFTKDYYTYVDFL